MLAGRNTLTLVYHAIQPSTKYGEDFIADRVAELTKYVSIKDKGIFRTPTNYIDCAISKIIDKNNISNRLALEGPIAGVASAKLGEKAFEF